MGFSRQEYWSGLLCPSPWDLPNPGIKPLSPASPALQAVYFPTDHLLPRCNCECVSMRGDHRHTGLEWYDCQAKYSPAAAAAKLLQSCPTLCDPRAGSPPGSAIPGILQARTLEWVAISFSNAWKWKVKVKSLSRVRPVVTPWTAAYQAPPSMRFSRQEYWSGLPLPSPKYSPRTS